MACKDSIEADREQDSREEKREHEYAKFVLRKVSDPKSSYQIPLVSSMILAAWTRHATAAALREEGYSHGFVNSYVLGHGNGHDRHMSFVPTPTIGVSQADGSIERMMVLEPRGPDGKVAELTRPKLSGVVLHRLVENDNGPRRTVPVCRLFEAQTDDIWGCYTRNSSAWHSVTPVVLHGYNSEHGKFSLKKTENLLYQAFEKSGYARQSIAELTFQPDAFWPGTEGALRMRMPEHMRKWPRYHVAVRFVQPIEGPIVAGIGRHYGIGLFAAPREKESS